MAVENVTYINSLDQSLPSGGDSIAEGDDHIRNVKKAIKGTFPNVTGQVTATQAQLNDASKIAGIEASLSSYNRDELGGAKYNGLTNPPSEWTSGVVGSVEEQSKSTYKVNFSKTLPDVQYVVALTPFAAAQRPVFGYVLSQERDHVIIKFSEWDGSNIINATEAGFTLLIMDAHEA